MIYPSKEEYVKLAQNYDIVPVYREILADTETPVSVLQRFAEAKNAFLLESMEGGETWGRYSFVGVDPELLFEVNHSQGRTGQLEALRDVYRSMRVAEIAGLPRFFGGAVGFIGYEGIGEFERMPEPKRCDSLVISRSRFLKADRIIVFDNIRHTVKIVVCTRPGIRTESCEPGFLTGAAAPDRPRAPSRLRGAPEALAPAMSAKPASPDSVSKDDGERVEEMYGAAVAEIEDIAQIMRRPVPAPESACYPPVNFKSNMTQDEYTGIVAKAKDYIYAGDIIQVVLSQRFSTETKVPPVQLYRALRLLNPSPYTFFLKIGDQTLVGSSPEVMVRLTGNRVELRPIAGTRPRGETEQADRKLADELLSDEKEKAEHVMLVDLGRNDVGRVAEAGSVQVTEYMVIERYSHVMHMVSHVEGILRKEFDAYDVIRATFPAGTLTGAPKIRAMEIIHELETEPRGAYGGTLGYISYSGNMDLAITIRTLDISRGTVSVQAGAGIVYDSDPKREFEETCHKARGMQKAVEMAVSGLEVR